MPNSDLRVDLVVDVASAEAARPVEQIENSLSQSPSLTLQSWMAALRPENAQLDIAGMQHLGAAWQDVRHEFIAMRASSLCPGRLRAEETQTSPERHGGLVDLLLSVFLMAFVVLATVLLSGCACWFTALALLCRYLVPLLRCTFEPLSLSSPFDTRLLIFLQELQQSTTRSADLVLQTCFELFSMTLVGMCQFLSVSAVWVITTLQLLLMVCAGACLFIGVTLKETTACTGLALCGVLACSPMRGHIARGRIRHQADVTQRKMCYSFCQCIAASDEQLAHVTVSNVCALANSLVDNLADAIEFVARVSHYSDAEAMMAQEGIPPPEMTMSTLEEGGPPPSSVGSALGDEGQSLRQSPEIEAESGSFAYARRLVERACETIGRFVHDVTGASSERAEVQGASTRTIVQTETGPSSSSGRPFLGGESDSLGGLARALMSADSSAPHNDVATSMPVRSADNPSNEKSLQVEGHGDPEYISCEEQPTEGEVPTCRLMASPEANGTVANKANKTSNFKTSVAQKESYRRPIRRGGQGKRIQKRASISTMPDTDDGWTD